MKKYFAFALFFALLLTACGGPVAEVTPAPAPAVETSEPTPTPEESVSPVYTDWSKLTPYRPAEVKYTRRYEGFTDRVIPAEDYGPLIPFAGNVVYSRRGGAFHIYGLVTLTGEVVTDPVFLSVEYLEGVEGTPLLLTKTFPGEDHPIRSALCAQDGSWCTDFVYGSGSRFGFGAIEVLGNLGYDRGIPIQKGKTGFVLLDPLTGEETYAVDWADALPEGVEVAWSSIDLDPATGWVSVETTYLGETNVVSLPLLFDPQGAVRPLPKEVTRLGRYSEGLIPAQGEKGLWGSIDTDGRWVIRAQYPSAEPLESGGALTEEEHDFPNEWGQLRGVSGGRAVFQAEGGTVTLTDLDGNILKVWDWGESNTVWLKSDPVTGEVYLFRWDWLDGALSSSYYDLEGNWIATGAARIAGGLVGRLTGDRYTLETLEGELVFAWPIDGGG